MTTIEGYGGHANITASGFVVRTLYLGENKPINENLLLRKIQEANVFFPQMNISALLTELLIEGVATRQKGKGWWLTPSMMELIGEYVQASEELKQADQQVQDAAE